MLGPGRGERWERERERDERLKQGAIGMPTKGMKVTLSSPQSIITKNTFHGLPYVTKYVWFKPRIGTLFNFCQLLCTFLRYLYSRIPSVVMLAHVYQGAGVRISFWLQLPITEIMTWNQIWGRKFVGMLVGSCFKVISALLNWRI